LLADLVRQSIPALHVVVASRRDPPFPVARLRGQGAYAEIVGTELACTREETELLVGGLVGQHDASLAADVHAATGGWPAAVRMVAEVLSRVDQAARRDHVTRLPAPGGPLFSYLTDEALAAEEPATRTLLERLAPFERVHAGLLAALDPTLAPTEAAARLESLARRGVWLQAADEPGWYVIPSLARTLLAERAGSLPADRRVGAEWFESVGEQALALATWRAGADPEPVASLLARRGRALLATGRVTDVADAIASLPAELRDEPLDLLHAEALHVCGDWEGALARLRRHAEGDRPISAERAWRLGIIHHLRGELDEAGAAYDRGVVDGGDPVNESLLLAWQGALAWLRGDAERCARCASAALALATEAGDDGALATAHTVAAMEAALRSDRAANDAHYLRALDHAAAARDVLLTIRVRTNRGSRMLEEGFYQEALVELDAAIALAELAGYTLFRALALSNRGEVLCSLGQLESAQRDLEAARGLYEQLGSRMVSYPLAHLGTVLVTKGDMVLARGAFEEAVRQAEAVGDLQGLVPALAGLARCLVDDDPTAAAAAAARAVELGPVLGRVGALVAAAEVDRIRGDDEGARHHATEATQVARARRDRAGLAEALEVLARVDTDRTTDLLDEAAAIWTTLGAPVGLARVELARLELLGDRDARHEERAIEADAISRRLQELGCRRLAVTARRLADRWRDAARPDLEVTTLGGFALRRGGQVVPVTQWQSRKARDLLKILIARRGPVPREQLLDLLWPDEDEARSARRLSVTLSTLRAVLDPGKHHPPDHVIVADGQALRLDRDHVAVDVDRFLDVAERALSLPADDPHRPPLLASAETIYVGDFLDEDLYDDWAVALRERARDAYVRVLRALATHASRSGDHEAAVRAYLRVLERDPYDEGAHLGLVRALADAGRHGESRRAYRAYGQRMSELDVEAVPYPARPA
jgi:DNA-binding SARP family transcriptional activator